MYISVVRITGSVLGVAVSGELAGIVDDKVGIAKVEQLLVGGADHHVADEQSMIGTRAYHANLELMLRNPANIPVNDVQALTRVQVIDGALTWESVPSDPMNSDKQGEIRGVPIDHEGVVTEREVDGSPPYVLLGGGLLDDALVLWAAPSVLAGPAHQSAGRGHRRAGLVLEGLLIQLRHTVPPIATVSEALHEQAKE